MGGGLVQLIAYGAQDIYLTGQPQITFFKSVYRRYTNFAIESIKQTINGSISFGSKTSITISRDADLLKQIWVEYSPQEMLSGVNNNVVCANVGHTLIDYVEILIGGQLIDRHYGKWLTIWNYLTDTNPSGQQGYIDTLGAGPGESSVDGDSATNIQLPRPTKYDRMAYTHRANLNVSNSTEAPIRAWVPLQFWFCRNPGLALPLVALQYHQVTINIGFAQYNSITDAPAPTGMEFNNFSVYADYIYLDTSERRIYAQNSHEYIIDQLQVMSNETRNSSTLTFNHPVKELIWSRVPDFFVNESTPAGPASPPSRFTMSTNISPNYYRLILNGTDRFTERDITYFTRNQVWESHTGFGSVMYPDSVAVYSFSLRPEEHQPSGTCNFSRLDLAQLNRTVADPIDIYALNYNVLRVTSGMAGLAFSN